MRIPTTTSEGKGREGKEGKRKEMEVEGWDWERVRKEKTEKGEHFDHSV